MAQLSKTAFLSKWATLFADNTTRDISEQDIRDFRQDISDSFLTISDNFVDEDDMVSDSATKAPSQQSVKAYVDAAALGIVTSWKAPVVNATTANITLSGEQTIDGVLTSASRILVKNQSTQSENGIYVTAAGAWARSSDANAAAELEGAAVTVQQGSTNANTTWIQTTDGITLGSSNIVWSQLGTSVPAADGSTAGIAKLYNNVSGTNTDGAPDQNSVNAALALKAPLASPTFTGTPTAPTAAGGTNTTQVATTAFVHATVIGVQELPIPAAAFWPRVTDGSTNLNQVEIATSLFNIKSLDFDQTTQEYAQIQFILPKKWNGGTITAKFYWTSIGGTGDVVWGISGRMYSSGDLLTAAFGTEVTVTDSLTAVNAVEISSATAAMTFAGSYSAGDILGLQVTRVAGDGSDTLNFDAKLMYVVLTITTTAATDV